MASEPRTQRSEQPLTPLRCVRGSDAIAVKTDR